MRNLAVLEPIEVERELYRGVPILHLHVDDPIPTPRAPERYAVLVHPDLARYLLTFNHPNNRKKKPSKVAKYARDMGQGFWAFTPESIVFSNVPLMEDGQNRLWAVEQAGARVWMMFDFGWPEDIIEVINRGSARTNADAFTVNGFSNAAAIAAAVGVVEKYHATVGTPLRWTQRLLTSSEALERYKINPEAWDSAASWGRRAYDSTQGLGMATWTAAFYLISEFCGHDHAAAFFQEFIDETGEPGSPTRKLKSHYLRRKLTDTASGDSREPMENIVRAFNAWRATKPAAFVRTGGAFPLTAIRGR